VTEVESWPPRWLTPVPEKAIQAGRDEEPICDFAEAYGLITKDSVAGGSGSPLVLRPWQVSLLEHMFAFENGGYRHQSQLVGMPRKNGKSALGSVIALYGLILGPKGAEVYSVAAEKEQARIVFQDAKRMLEGSPELSGITKLYRDAIELPKMGSVYRVVSAEAYSKEGLSPTLTVMDEVHAQKNRELYDTFSLAMGARGNLATLIGITTAGVKADSTGRDSIAYSLYQYGQKVARGEVDDPSFFMAWWEAPEEADHKLEDTWRIANPGLGDLNAIADFESAVRRTPEAEFRTKRCNQWVSSQLSWLPTGAWEACEAEFTVSPDDEIVLGFDGSFSGDASVIVGAVVPKGDESVKVFMVKSWEKDITIHDDEWRVDIAEVEQTILDFCQAHPKVREVACDPFRWQRSMGILQDKGVPIVEWPSTSARRMVTAGALVFDAVMEKRLIHDGNPVLTRHLSNAITKLDNVGPRIVKDSRNSPRKIDAAVAMTIAVDRALGGGKLEEPPQFFD
jgi:phage terminase large subunit-like protein